MLKDLWLHEKVWRRAVSQPDLFLFLDYDGTLSKIVKRPDLAKLSPSRRKLLKNLSLIKGIHICVISGRGLKNVKKLVALPDLIYAGNHGLELKSPKFRYLHPQAKPGAVLIRGITSRLKKIFSSWSGILVENKVYTASIHYRALPLSAVSRAQKMLLEVLREPLKKKQIILRGGKKVWEIRPSIRWDKGAMVNFLLTRYQKQYPDIFPIYIGDDETDEDGLRAIKKRGLGIKVAASAGKPSAARYRLHSPDDVFRFLRKIYSQRIQNT